MLKEIEPSVKNETEEIINTEKEENEKFLQNFEDVSKQYQFGFSPDPTDRKPYELSGRCYYCLASFSIENLVKNFKNSNKVPNMGQQNIKLVSKHCQCGKAVPSCAVCLTSIGIMNYQVELLLRKNK